MPVYLLSSIFLLCSGCNHIWPKYERPKLSEPDHWQHNNPRTKLENQTTADLAWWKRCHNPELNQFIHLALLNNNDLHVAWGNTRQAKAALQKVQAAWIPTLNLGGVGTIGQLNNFVVEDKKEGTSILNTLDQRTVWPYNGYTAGFMPNYTINLLAQIKEQEIATLNLASSLEIWHAIRLTVISQMAASYFTLLGLKQQLLIQNQLIEDLQAMKKYTVLKHQYGAVSQMRIDSIDQDIASIRKAIPSIEIGIVQAENAINVLLNKNPSPVITHKTFEEINANEIIPVNLPASVIRQRPDVAMAEHQLQSAYAGVGLASSQFFPSVNLNAFWNKVAFTFVNFFAGAGLLQGAALAGMPLLNVGILTDIKRAHSVKYMAYYRYVQTVRSAFADVDNALTKHHKSFQSYQQQDIALHKSDAQYQAARYQYHQGAISYADTINYRFNKDYMNAVLNKYKLQQMGSIVALYLALGAGATADTSQKQPIIAGEATYPDS